MGNVDVKWGDGSGTCQLCFTDQERFGTLVDPNGHKWLICALCINALWDGRQMLNMEQADRDRQAEAVDAALGRLRNLLIEGSELWLRTTWNGAIRGAPIVLINVITHPTMVANGAV